MTRIAKLLNDELKTLPGQEAEAIRPARGKGWAPSAIREVLYRPLYRGRIVWNQRQKIRRGGTKKLRLRPESEWLRLDAPESSRRTLRKPSRGG